MKNKSLFILLGSIVLSTISLGMTSCSSPSISENIENSISNVEINGSLKNEYYKSEAFDFSTITFHVEYKNKNSEEINGTDSRIEKSGDNTSSIGSNYSITLSYFKYSKTFNFSVRNPIINLDFNGGTYNDSTDSVSVEASSSLTNVSSYSPESSQEGYEFAGWFYDKEHTQRVESAIDGYVNITKDTTIYAGYDKDYSNMFNYNIENGEVTITSLKLNQDNIFEMAALKEIVIPTTIKLYPVTKIASSGGFISNLYSTFLNLEKIIFPKDSYVKEIGDNFITEYGKLKSIELPDSLETIGDNAFSSSGLSGTLSLPKSIKRIGEAAFLYCNFQKVDFTKATNLKLIGSEAFKGCENICEINLPESVIEVRKEAFSNCTNLTNVHLGQNLFNIGVHAFSGCTELVAFDVDSKNESYKSIDGNLYSKDGTTFIRYCFGKQETEFTLPEGVTEIYESAFDLYQNISPLKKINLPNTLTYIGNNAFSEGSFSFVLPASLTNVAPHAFNKWKGTGFQISPENHSFSVKDGALYTKDHKSLVCIPYSYGHEEFTLDSRVETIWNGALYNNETIKYITIPEDSNLQNIEEGGFVFYSCKKLVGVYIEKDTPFTLARNAAYSSEYYFNGDFIIYVDEKNFSSYSSSWENYEYDDSTLGFNDLNPSHYLVSKQNAGETVYSKVLDKLYANQNLTLEQLNQYYDDLDFDYWSIRNSLFFLDSYYKLGIQSEYDKYFETIELRSYEIITSYYEGLTDQQLGSENNIEVFVDRYNTIPQSTTAKMPLVKASLDNISERTQKVYEFELTIVDRIFDYYNRLKTINYDDVQQLLNDYSNYSTVLVTNARNVSSRYYTIIVSNSIYSLLNSNMEINASNIKNIASILYGDGYYDLGTEGYLEYYVSSEIELASLYGYEEYIIYRDNFLNYLTKCNNDIINYDFNSEYDLELAFELYLAYTNMPDNFRDYSAFDNYVGIVLRININYFINYDFNQGITDEIVACYNEIENDILQFDLISEEEQNLFTEKEKIYLDLLNKTSTSQG